MRGIAPLIGNVLFNLLWPARGRARLEKQIETALARGASQTVTAAQNLSELIEAIEAMPAKMPQKMLPRLVGGIAAGQMPYQILLRQAATIPGGPELVMELTRGLPHNVTTQMDLALWRTCPGHPRRCQRRSSLLHDRDRDAGGRIPAGTVARGRTNRHPGFFCNLWDARRR